MEQIFNECGHPLDMKQLEFLSDKGSEFYVYKYMDMVVKIYKEDYILSHLSLEEINILKKIPTQRILLPTSCLFNQKHELIGYEMPFIIGQRNIENDRVRDFFEELKILKQDLDLLCNHFIILRDINLSNAIYNGHIYLIDPGNYLINALDQIILHVNITNSLLSEKLKKIIMARDYSKINTLINSLTIEEKQNILIEWNYNKINILIDLLLFSKKSNIDPFQYRQIVQFFMKEKEKRNLKYNLEVLEMYFNPNLNIGDAIDDFMKQYIKDDPKERALYLSLYNKRLK